MDRPFRGLARRLHRRLGRYLEDTCQGRRPGGVFENNQGRESLSHESERQSLARVLADLGHQNPMEPLFLLEAFLSTEDHLTPALYREILGKNGRQVTVENAVEALELFRALGFAEKRLSLSGEAVYEHRHLGGHHDHLICERCGKTQEFMDSHVDRRLEKSALAYGYSHLSHRLVIEGLCPDCRQERGETIRLSEAAVGEDLTIMAIEGDEEMAAKLASMGLYKGVEISVLGGSGGSLVLLLGGCRLGLGAELANLILVREAEGRHRVCRRHGLSR